MTTELGALPLYFYQISSDDQTKKNEIVGSYGSYG
jgi:hypothetical protein